MNLNELFKNVQKSFTIQKVVSVEGYNIEFLLESLTSEEELKILEACANLEGGAFIVQLKRSTLAYAIKRINDMDFTAPIIEYEDENGKKIKETKYKCLSKQIDAMSTALRDLLFEAFNNIQLEVEAKVNKSVKFDRFTLQEAPKKQDLKEVGIPEGFRKIDESKAPLEDMNETEKLNQTVKEEERLVETFMSNSADK